MMSMSGTTSHGGPEVVFEVVVTTDKPDDIASRNQMQHPSNLDIKIENKTRECCEE